MLKCKQCGSTYEDGNKFCSNCGKELEQYITMGEPPSQPATDQKKKHKRAGRRIAILCIVVLLLGILCFCVVRFYPKLIDKADKTKSPDPDDVQVNKQYALFLKDDEIFYADLKKMESVQVSHNLLATPQGENSGRYQASSYDLGEFAFLSADGKKLFYPDRYSNEDTGVSLYCSRMDDKENESVKIDSNVLYYCTNEKSDLVFYLKGDERILYQYDFTEKTKIATNVSLFYISNDGKKVVFATEDNMIYLKNEGEDKVKIVSDAYIQNVSPDLSTIYYKKDETLYIQKEGQEKVKVDSDVNRVIQVYSGDRFYYTRNEPYTVSLLTYVDDDMLSTDNDILSIPEPQRDDYDYSYEYRDDYEYWENKRERALAREDLRDELEDKPTTIYRTALYYYNGTESIKISEDFTFNYECSETVPIITYTECDKTNAKKFPLSSIDSYTDFEWEVKRMLSESKKLFVAISDTATEIEQYNASTCAISQDGTVIYYYDDIKEKTADLYRITISGNSVGKPELYGSDVSWTDPACITNNNSLCYFKDVSNDIGDLFIGNKNIDYDVYIYEVTYNARTDQMFYLSDCSSTTFFDSEIYYGTLKIYSGEESQRVADDVIFFSLMPDGSVLYIYDYSATSQTGELRRYNKSETEKIADDVQYIIQILDYKTMMETYGYGAHAFW